MTTASTIREPDAETQWCVVHARPRCEKKILALCRQHAVEAYLPLLPKRHRYGARIRITETPLFRGYVFVCASARDRSFLRQNDYVANLLETSRQTELYQELRALAHSLSVVRVVDVLPYLEEGRRVAIQTGPFKGMEGMILRVKNQDRVVIQIELIQQSVVFEADSASVKPE